MIGTKRVFLNSFWPYHFDHKNMYNKFTYSATVFVENFFLINVTHEKDRENDEEFNGISGF